MHQRRCTLAAAKPRMHEFEGPGRFVSADGGGEKVQRLLLVGISFVAIGRVLNALIGFFDLLSGFLHRFVDLLAGMLCRAFLLLAAG